MAFWKIKTRRGKLDVGEAGTMWLRFARYVRPQRLALMAAFLTAMGAVATQLAAPWPIKLIFDSVLSDKPLPAWLAVLAPGASATPSSLLALTCGAILLIGILDAVFSHVRDITLADVGQRVVGNIRRDLFAHFQTLPPSVYERRRTGDLLMRLTGDVQMLRIMLVGAVITLGQSGLTVAAMVIAMVWFNPLLAAVSLATIPLTGFAGWRISRQIRRASADAREKESVVANIAHDVLGAMSVIQAFNRQPVEQKRFSRGNRSTVRAGLKTTRLESKLDRTVALASTAATCAIVYLGVDSVLRGKMTAGGLLVFISYLRAMNKPIRQMAKLAGQAAKATTCAERIAEVFALRPAVQDAPHSQPLVDVRGAVTFENVSFRYDEGAAAALSEVSLQFEPGRRVAIVGHSGAGKSTLAKLLLRFHDPSEGCIRIDGADLREVTLASLRRQIGWVHQDTILFGMTIAENIALGCPDASEASIREIARRVHADEFIEELPERYETILGQSGSTLSGGQRQRIALARALLHQPRILLLDEPASGLDAVSRRRVEEAWLSPSNTATTLVICHRLRDMERFDQVVVLRQGRLCEYGTHAELLAKRGEYAAMFAAGQRPSEGEESRERVAC